MTENGAASANLKPRAQEQGWSALTAMRRGLPQGLILLGPSGVGKRRAVKALFQLIHCTGHLPQDEAGGGSLFGEPMLEKPVATQQDATEPCGACSSCRKIAEGKHADLIEILPKGDTIPVDDLREMKKTLFFAPIEGKLRFVIIDEAHKLNVSSANTLLKTIEEPPSHTRFFLITHERGLLLPTIVSRCQFLHFSPLDDATLRELLSEQSYEIPQDLMPICLKLMSGGLNRAPLLANEKTLEFIQTVQAELLRPRSDWNNITQLAEALTAAGAAGPSADWKLELLLDLLVLAGHRGALSSRTLEEALKQAGRALDAAYLRRRLDRHANKKLVALAASELAHR